MSQNPFLAAARADKPLPPPEPDVAKLMAWAKSPDGELVDYFKGAATWFCGRVAEGMKKASPTERIESVPYSDRKKLPYDIGYPFGFGLKVDASIAVSNSADAGSDLRLNHATADTVEKLKGLVKEVAFREIEISATPGSPGTLHLEIKKPIELPWPTVQDREVVVNVLFYKDFDEDSLREYHQKARGS